MSFNEDEIAAYQKKMEEENDSGDESGEGESGEDDEDVKLLNIENLR
jgi:hypothetical protein